MKAKHYNRLCYPSQGLSLVLDIIVTEVITTTVSAAELLPKHKVPACGGIGRAVGATTTHREVAGPWGASGLTQLVSKELRNCLHVYALQGRPRPPQTPMPTPGNPSLPRLSFLAPAGAVC